MTNTKLAEALKDAIEGECNGLAITNEQAEAVLAHLTAHDAEQAPIDLVCSTDPRAPHGFDRNASHNEGRYVCECESWSPAPAPEAQAGDSGLKRFLALAEAAGIKSINDLPGLIPALQATEAQAAGQELPPLPETGYTLFYEDAGDEDHGDEGYQEVIDAPAYTADQMRAYARAAMAQRQPLTEERIDAMAHEEGDYDPRTCSWSFNGDTDCRYNLTNFARAIERAHGIGGATTGEQRR